MGQAMHSALGLCGAQRVGKSTLADAFAKRVGIAFVQTDTSGVFQALGRDPKAEYPMHERIGIQEAILSATVKQYADAAKRTPNWITDRTPLDMAAYLLMDVRRSTFKDTPWLAPLVTDYVRRCIEETNRWFAAVVLVQPGIEVKEAPGKAPGCPAHMAHMNAMLMGLMQDEGLYARHYYIPRRYTDLEQRCQALAQTCLNLLEKAKQQAEYREHAGLQLH